MARPASKKTSSGLSAADVKDRAESLTEEYLRCRDNGHIWNQYRLMKVRGGYERSFYCKFCKTAKHQFISKTGEILAGNYSYQSGYQLTGVGRLYGNHRAILRLEHLERQVASAEAQHMIYETDEGTVIGELAATP